MDKPYMVVLWNDSFEDDDDAHKIESFATLKEAVIFMIDNGALYEHKDLVQKVDWMPGESKPVTTPTMASQAPEKDPEEIALSKKPNPKPIAQEQPVVIGDTPKPKMKTSIFEGHVPKEMIPIIQRST